LLIKISVVDWSIIIVDFGFMEINTIVTKS
jgi:hypothetical protein